jgi:hypothetical protein
MKKRTFTLLMIMAVIAAMCFTACGKSSKATLESYVNDHPDMRTEIDEQLGSEDTAGVTVDFKGNEMIYSMDISGMDNMTEELAKSDSVKESLEAGLEQQSDAFEATAASVLQSIRDEGEQIETVKVTVNYTYGDEVIATASFDADDDDSDDAEEAESDDSDDDDDDEEAEG